MSDSWKQATEASSLQCRCFPLVIVQGFLGHTESRIWGDFERHLNQNCPECERKVIFASVGPVSSLHDRACELYYSLVGGTVDYGEEHSKAHAHSRYGRTHAQGLYPQWSLENPIHLLGHSLGGPTIVKLQYLMKQGHFGPHAHPDWIRSINTISAPFRGTQAVYTLGERVDAAPKVRPFSAGSMLSKAIHTISYFSPILPKAFDLHTESRRLSFRDISIFCLLKMLWKSEWAESQDAAPFDVTFESADQREANQEGQPYPQTFYRSCATYLTEKSEQNSNLHTVSFTNSLSFLLVAPLLFLARVIGSFDFSIIRPVPSFLDEISTIPTDVEKGKLYTADYRKSLPEEYWANDGVVPLFSQWHPASCCSTRCQHVETRVPAPGIWYVEQWDKTSHSSLVPLWVASDRQKQYWLNLGRWLRGIELQGVCT
ncbi:alpha/beta-hydrolase [Lentinula aciculospora]|uniref:Alpha/beta-hydrolase n=1 Tax=Lentinula aciculospora TaxID=153920 RepID=A0A9W9ALW9_9AGAR|nr:alpha/beta-hydrolase [Lentinula aciculospora]